MRNGWLRLLGRTHFDRKFSRDELTKWENDFDELVFKGVESVSKAHVLFLTSLLLLFALFGGSCFWILFKNLFAEERGQERSELLFLTSDTDCWHLTIMPKLLSNSDTPNIENCRSIKIPVDFLAMENLASILDNSERRTRQRAVGKTHGNQ